MEAGSESVSSYPSAGSYAEFPINKDKKGIWIFGESDSQRRVVLIERNEGSFGFTLQSYGLKYKLGNRETDFITYVNAVEKNGPAFKAGLRQGDVILSVNGESIARVDHKALVNFIRQCPSILKLLVVSDERARKVELHMRYFHLQRKLQGKLKELENLTIQEKEIVSGTYSKSPSTTNCPSSTSSCCFCPTNDRRDDGKGFPATTTIIRPQSEIEDVKLKQVIQQRSKSLKQRIEENDGVIRHDISNICFTNAYRKCQSSRELNTEKNTSDVRENESISTQIRKDDRHHHQQQKPKSWDNLIAGGTTKSFGGYGYGYGYGYFPLLKDAVTHPHHHNHHSYSRCSHAQNYYTNASEGTSKVKVVYNYVAPTYNTNFPHKSFQDPSSSTTTADRNSNEGIYVHHRSRTLPSSSKSMKDSHKSNQHSCTPKLEKTYSDTSLSEHYKETSKTSAYFERSGDNVRFPSTEQLPQYNQCNHSRKKSGSRDERICV